MRRIRLLGIFYLMAGTALWMAAAGPEKSGPADKYQDWLKLTEYIILPQEKAVLRHLDNDKDRDVFIRAFWKQRDPTPGTPQNEFQDEHVRRYIYANTHLGRETPREGWMTDRGRIYILLGSPHSIERFDSQSGLHPSEVWYYYGDKSKGLPTYFGVLFYQRNGSGEYRLYNPTGDGPHSLLVDSRGIDIYDHRQAYERIRELAPTLADISISLIPGERPLNFIPSPRNNMILSDIFETHKKNVTPTYATHFLDYVGVVSTEYLTNFVESVLVTALVFDPSTQSQFLHFSINPAKLSIDYYAPQDKYYCSFQLNVSLRQGERMVYQYSKDIPFYFNPQDLDRVQGNGISIQDIFPIIEGEYRLVILIQNSVGKEFSVSEKNIVVPKAAGPPKIVGPVLGFELKESFSPLQVPFKLSGKKIEVDAANTFSSTEQVVIFFNLHNVTRDLWQEGSVNISIKGMREGHESPKNYAVKLRDFPYSEVLGITHSIPAGDFSPDYYEVRLTLENGNQNVLDGEASRFIISPKEIVPHPVILTKSFPSSKSYLYYYSLAYQYDQAGKFKEAEAAYTKALGMNPDFHTGRIEFAHYLLRQNKIQKAMELVEPLRQDTQTQFDFYLIRGLAHMQSRHFQQAIVDLAAGNALYDSDVRLLNALGICYNQMGQKKQAREALEASLRLNPDQKNIQRLLSEIEKAQNER